jgi:hypothetical protein
MGSMGYERDQPAYELGSGIHGSRYETLAADLLHYLDEEERSKAGSTSGGTYKCYTLLVGRKGERGCFLGWAV